MPAVTPWFAGAQVPLTFPLTDTTGTPRNAVSGLGVVSVTVTQPDGTLGSVGTVSNPSTGTYAATFTSVQAGHHIFAWTCTDATYPGAFSDSFEVQAAQDATIVSLAEAKGILHQTASTVNDAKIQGYNASATNWIEYVCGPVIQQTIVEKLPSRGIMQALSKPPVISLLPWATFPPGMSGLGIALPVPASPMFPCMVFGIPYPTGQLYADPATGIVTHTSGLPFIYGSYMWQYKAGRLVIPPGIYEAAKIVLKHLWMVEAAGTGTGTGTGDEQTVQTPFGFAVPNRAAELLLPYKAASKMVAA
jgi:hypothetical protein